jgi:hypothetical protein
MNVQVISYIIFDEAELPESVHEKTNPRTGRPHHLGKSSLA